METFRSEPAPSAEQAAAIIAALERFRRDTAPPPVPAVVAPRPSVWKRLALAEGVARQPEPRP